MKENWARETLKKDFRDPTRRVLGFVVFPCAMWIAVNRIGTDQGKFSNFLNFLPYVVDIPLRGCEQVESLLNTYECAP